MKKPPHLEFGFQVAFVIAFEFESRIHERLAIFDAGEDVLDGASFFFMKEHVVRGHERNAGFTVDLQRAEQAFVVATVE